MKTIILAAVLVLGMQRAWSQSRTANATAGFGDLDSMATEFVRCLKSSPEQLKSFCERINLDTGIVGFMQRNYNYTPSVIAYLKKNDLDIGAISENYCRFMFDFRETLRRRGKLDRLEYLGREEKETQMSKSSQHVVDWTATFFLFKSGDATYKCGFGEMIRINRQWKTMTEPKFVMF